MKGRFMNEKILVARYNHLSNIFKKFSRLQW
jgi:hypothetical protein